MKRSSKILITSVAVIGITAAGISLVSADGWGCQGYGKHGRDYRGMGMMGGAPSEKIERRLEYLKNELEITPEQEPAWEALKQDISTKVTTMRVGFKQRGSQLAVTERTERMRQNAQQMSNLADAIDEFYRILTPEQQEVADNMRPMGRRF